MFTSGKSARARRALVTFAVLCGSVSHERRRPRQRIGQGVPHLLRAPQPGEALEAQPADGILHHAPASPTPPPTHVAFPCHDFTSPRRDPVVKKPTTRGGSIAPSLRTGPLRDRFPGPSVALTGATPGRAADSGSAVCSAVWRPTSWGDRRAMIGRNGRGETKTTLSSGDLLGSGRRNFQPGSIGNSNFSGLRLPDPTWRDTGPGGRIRQCRLPCRMVADLVGRSTRHDRAKWTRGDENDAIVRGSPRIRARQLSTWVDWKQ